MTNNQKVYSEKTYSNIETITYQIEKYLHNKNFIKLESLINELAHFEIMDIILSIDLNLLKDFILIIEKDLEPYMIPNLDNNRAKLIFEILGSSKFSKIINKFEDYEFYSFIHQHTDLNEYEDLEQNLDMEKRQILKEFYNYPPNSAGRLMQKNIIALSHEWNIRKIKDYLRHTIDISNHTERVFLINDQNQILGSISLIKLLKSPPDLVAHEIIDKHFTVIDYDMDQKKITQLFKRYSLPYALVADNDQKIIGIITLDDAIDAMEVQADKDFMHLQYITNSETVESKNILTSISARTPWLFINIVFSMLVSSFIGLFSNVMQRHIELAILIPIIASISSISGAQTVATTIHTLAKQEVNKGSILKTFAHEINTSVMLAFIMALLSGLVVFWRFGQPISVLYFLSMFIAFIIASLSGIFVPLITHFIKLDPAIISPILVTTISDFSSYFLALMLAIWLLS